MQGQSFSFFFFEEAVRKFINNSFIKFGSVENEGTPLCSVTDWVIGEVIINVNNEAYIGTFLFRSKTSADALTKRHFCSACTCKNDHSNSRNVYANIKNS